PKLGKLIATERTSQHIGQVEDAHTRQKSAHRSSAVPSKTTVTAKPATARSGAKCIMAGSRPAMISSYKKALVASVEDRLDLDDGPTVIAADPKRARIGAIVDEHPADVGGTRQLVFDVLAGLHVKARDAVVQHRAGPSGPVLAGHRVIGGAPG